MNMNNDEHTDRQPSLIAVMVTFNITKSKEKTTQGSGHNGGSHVCYCPSIHKYTATLFTVVMAFVCRGINCTEMVQKAEFSWRWSIYIKFHREASCSVAPSMTVL